MIRSDHRDGHRAPVPLPGPLRLSPAFAFAGRDARARDAAGPPASRRRGRAARGARRRRAGVGQEPARARARRRGRRRGRNRALRRLRRRRRLALRAVRDGARAPRPARRCRDAATAPRTRRRRADPAPARSSRPVWASCRRRCGRRGHGAAPAPHGRDGPARRGSAQSAPLLVVLEDVHWADASTLLPHAPPRPVGRGGADAARRDLPRRRGRRPRGARRGARRRVPDRRRGPDPARRASSEAEIAEFVRLAAGVEPEPDLTGGDPRAHRRQRVPRHRALARAARGGRGRGRAGRRPPRPTRRRARHARRRCARSSASGSRACPPEANEVLALAAVAGADFELDDGPRTAIVPERGAARRRRRGRPRTGCSSRSPADGLPIASPTSSSGGPSPTGSPPRARPRSTCSSPRRSRRGTPARRQPRRRWPRSRTTTRRRPRSAESSGRSTTTCSPRTRRRARSPSARPRRGSSVALELGVRDPAERADVMLRLGDARHRAGHADAALDAFSRAAELARALGDAELLARAAIGFEEACWRPAIHDAGGRRAARGGGRRARAGRLGAPRARARRARARARAARGARAAPRSCATSRSRCRAAAATAHARRRRSPPRTGRAGSSTNEDVNRDAARGPRHRPRARRRRDRGRGALLARPVVRRPVRPRRGARDGSASLLRRRAPAERAVPPPRRRALRGGARALRRRPRGGRGRGEALPGVGPAADRARRVGHVRDPDVRPPTRAGPPRRARAGRPPPRRGRARERVGARVSRRSSPSSAWWTTRAASCGRILDDGLGALRPSLWLASLVYLADACAALGDDEAAGCSTRELAAYSGSQRDDRPPRRLLRRDGPLPGHDCGRPRRLGAGRGALPRGPRPQHAARRADLARAHRLRVRADAPRAERRATTARTRGGSSGSRSGSRRTIGLPALARRTAELGADVDAVARRCPTA